MSHEGIWTEYRPTYWDGWSAVKRMGGLVRCKECEWFDFDICACKRRPLHMAVEPDGFCAWASRKESE